MLHVFVLLLLLYFLDSEQPPSLAHRQHSEGTGLLQPAAAGVLCARTDVNIF